MEDYQDANNISYFLNVSDANEKTIRIEACFYGMSISAAVFVTAVYVLIFNTVRRHVTIDGVHITILKYICTFDLLHMYLQTIAIYLCNNWRYSIAFSVVRFATHTTFLITVLLNPLLNVNQLLKIRYGLHYHHILDNSNVTRSICIYICVIVCAHLVSFVFKWETYLFAVMLPSATVAIFVLTVTILWYASKEYPSNTGIVRQLHVTKDKWKKYLSRAALFIALSMSIMKTIFSIRHGGQKISYICIKVAMTLACVYLIFSPLIHVWMMADIKKFFIKDIMDTRDNFLLWYTTHEKKLASSGGGDKSKNVDTKNKEVYL